MQDLEVAPEDRDRNAIAEIVGDLYHDLMPKLREEWVTEALSLEESGVPAEFAEGRVTCSPLPQPV